MNTFLSCPSNRLYCCSVIDKKWIPPKRTYYEWTRAEMCYPKDHLKTPKYLCIRHKEFRRSYTDCFPCGDGKCCYSRMWAREVQLFRKQQQMKCNRFAAPPQRRFCMKKFMNICGRTDSKRKCKPCPPPCNPRTAFRCPCCKNC